MLEVLSRARTAALVLVCLWVPGAVALTSDREQPINIEADQVDVDDRRRVTVYKGAVVIVQGTLRITGDTVTIHYDDNRDMTKMVALGRPARFRQRAEGKADYQRARALRMEYYTAENLIVLLGEAHYDEGADKISADRIVYDTVQGRVRARTEQAGVPGGAASKPGSRVRITIVPKNKQQ